MNNISEKIIIQKLENKLTEIYEILKNNNKPEEIGVLTGISGILIFFFQYSDLKKDSDSYELGINLIKENFKKINNGYENSTYCSGIAGFGWTLEYLLEQNHVDFNNDTLLTDLDGYLKANMNQDLKNNDFDFLHGGIGFGYYFLKRYKNTKSNSLKEKYKKILIKIINCLDKNAEKENDTIKWASKTNSKKPKYDLSLAHGITSIVNFLCRLNDFEDFKHLTTPMIKKGSNYILSCINQKETAFSLFPNGVSEESYFPNSRLAWCYGDLGIAITLLQASKTLNEIDLAKRATEILLHSTKRKLVEETLVKDPGVCHGAFGVALIYNRIFKETGEIEFYNACLHWCNEGLEMAIHKDGYAGYKKLNDGKGGVWENEISLLEGIAGIGLTITSILSLSDSKWEECLMLK